MKNLAYAAAALGVIALIAGAYIKFGTAHHHGLETMAGGAVLLVAGIVMLVMKPKAKVA